MNTVRKLFRLPDLGEGLTDSEIVAWRVAVGDAVALNQTLADVETAKAVVELPSPYAGTVAELFADAGMLVQVGSPLVAFDVPDEAGASGPDAGAPDGAQQDSQEQDSQEQDRGEPDSGSTGSGAGGGTTPFPPSVRAEGGNGSDAGGPGHGGQDAGATVPGRRRPTLVGYGAEPEPTGHPVRKPRRTQAAAAGAAPEQPPTGPIQTGQSPAGHRPGERGPEHAPDLGGGPEGPESEGGPGERPRSTPPVRKLAHDLGIDLSTVTGTGDHGLITRADIEAAHHAAVSGTAPAHRVPGQATPPQPKPEMAGAPPERPAAGATTAPPQTPPQTLPQAAAQTPPQAEPRTLGGRPREERIPIHGLRMRTAAAVSASASTAPHITEFLTIDATAGMELLAKLRKHPAFAGTKPTPLALTAKAVCLALERTPALNARWDQAAGQIVQFNYVNLGIAAATPRGLLVPNIKDAQALGLADLARSLAKLADAARSGSTTPHDLTGGTITITNVGVFGVDAGTPILNPGEAAILALGQVARRPWEHRGKVALRDVVTLSLSVDHRVVDGEEASRFLVDVGTILSDPAMLIAML